MIQQDKFKVIIPQSTYDKVMYFVNKTNFEVSGFAHVDYDPQTQTFYVGEPFLCKQENHSTETEMDANSIGKAMYRLAMQGKELRWWWHSHVNMGVFWSGTDMATMRQLGGNGWILATVFNKKYEMLSALMTSAEQFGEKIEVFVDKISTTVTSPEIPDELIKQWDAEFNEMVTIKSYTKDWGKGTEVGRYSGYGLGYGHMGDDANMSWHDDRYWDRGYANGNVIDHSRSGKKKRKKNKQRPQLDPIDPNGLLTDEFIDKRCKYFGVPRDTYMDVYLKYGEDTDLILYEELILQQDPEEEMIGDQNAALS